MEDMRQDGDFLVVGIGEALWDMLPAGKQVGGATANFAYHMGQFGFRSRVVSAVGHDALGRELVDAFHARCINMVMAEVDYPTGTVAVEVDASGVPAYDITVDVAWDHIPFTPALESVARRTRAVIFGSLAQRGAESRDTIARFLDAMPSGGDVLKVFDINLRQGFFSAEVVAESLDRCNVLKINDEELAVLGRLFGWHGGDTRLWCRNLLSRCDLRYLVLTCGVNGSYVFAGGGEESYRPTPVVEVADTVGAGDSFAASFVASVLRGRDVAQAHELAAEVSAYVCTQFGAMPVLPARFTDRLR